MSRYISFYKLVITTLLLSIPILMPAQHFVPAEKGCKVEFKAIKRKDGIQVVRGLLSNLKGKIVFDPQHLNTASFEMSVSAGSINTDRPEWDYDLKKIPFFNLAKYPLIKIKSTSVTTDRPGSIIYEMHGDLTINNVTKPVTIQFTASPFGTAYLFRGSLEFSRLAFNLGNKDDGIDDKISVFIEVRTKKAAN